MRESLRASRSYLRRHGIPQSVAELRGHKLLGRQLPQDAVERWPLLDGGSFEFSPMLTATDQNLLRRFAGLGFGIDLLPDSDLPEAELTEAEDEALVPVLPGLVGRTRQLSVSVSEVLAETAKTQAVLDHLERFASMIREQAPVLSAQPVPTTRPHWPA